MGEKPSLPPVSLGYVDPHLIHQCMGPSHSVPQMAAQSVHVLSHNNTINSPLVRMGRPISTPQIAPLRGAIVNPNYLPHPPTQPTHHLKRHPDPISRFPQLTHRTYRQTDR